MDAYSCEFYLIEAIYSQSTEQRNRERTEGAMRKTTYKKYEASITERIRLKCTDV